jgi:hypothetical protein
MTVNNDSIIKNDIRARELMQVWFNEHGINPEVHIWQDTQRAYIASDAAVMYPAVADVLGVAFDGEDTSVVDDALWGAYLSYCEQAEMQVRRETLEAVTISEYEPSQTSAGASGMAYRQGEQIVTWEGKDGFYGCFAGVGEGGNYSESDDQGPYESRQDAIEALEGSIEDVEENEQWDEVY